ncbi:MAG TPA: pyridoxamine 5'-phosphate oxidase family protein, partial [Polyangiaceae bacterium]
MLRRREFAMDRGEALARLCTARVVRFATTLADGEPVLRTVNPIVHENWLAFHGAPSGEKARCIGRDAVFQWDEVVATIPSYFVDPERACPATTFYRSVQVRGRLERLDEPELKAVLLRRLMEHYQPEGGYAPLRADSPLYANALRGVLVLGVRLTDVTGKRKLGQGRKQQELTAILEGLWARGEEGDPLAIEAILSANPDVPVPSFLRGPEGTRLVCA